MLHMHCPSFIASKNKVPVWKDEKGIHMSSLPYLGLQLGKPDF